MSEWTFITKHGFIFSYIAKHPTVTTREIAVAAQVTERTAHKMISDLELAGYVTKIKEGRRNRYRINPELSLRDPHHDEVAVGALLKVLGWRRPRKTERQAKLL